MTHFSKGSEKPARKGDTIRLYNMRFCPFAQRARLVLKAKGIEYDCVNVNLKDKPDWFYELNPVGKVPVIEMPDGKVLYESTICCEFLEEMYPEKAQLFPKDPYEKHKQRLLVEVLGNKLSSAVYKALRGGDEAKEELDKHLVAFENELKNVNQTFIGGSLKSQGKLPDFYRRYVDDTLVKMPDLAAATAFLDTLNHAHSAVSFTMEVEENGMLPFLGLQLLNRAPCVETKVYVKPTNTGLLLHYHSHVDSRYKQGLLVTMLDRAHRLSSSWTHFSEECERLRGVFRKLRYPNHLIDSVINKFITSRVAAEQI